MTLEKTNTSSTESTLLDEPDGVSTSLLADGFLGKRKRTQEAMNNNDNHVICINDDDDASNEDSGGDDNASNEDSGGDDDASNEDSGGDDDKNRRVRQKATVLRNRSLPKVHITTITKNRLTNETTVRTSFSVPPSETSAVPLCLAAPADDDGPSSSE
eukprot:gene10736-11924_t